MFPPHASGNVGDKILEEEKQHLIQKESGINDFDIVSRGYDFSSTVDYLNGSDAIILPGFAIRDPIYSDTCRLIENLDDIEPPIIPIASGWSHYPGN
jgi:hypothetical protein